MKLLKRLLFAIIHGLILLIASFIIMQIPYALGDELIIVQTTSLFRRLALGFDEKPPQSRFLFVNVCYDKALIDKLDPDGFPIGNQAITDREKLARFINILKRSSKPPKFVLCDIFFKDPSPQDSLLTDAFANLKNYVVSYHLTQDRLPDKPCLPVELGLSDYMTVNGMFLKFKLFQRDTLKTVPVIMYEKIHEAQFSENGLFRIVDGYPYLNMFVLDLRVRKFDLTLAKQPYTQVNLGELLILPDSAIQKLAQDRIVILGDFLDLDQHQTIYGETPGALILLNAFLALENGDNRVSWHYVLFLWLGLTIFSFELLVEVNRLEVWLAKKLHSYKLSLFFLSLTADITLLITISVLSYLLYSIHVNILLFSIYAGIFKKAISYYRDKKRAKGQHPAL